MKEISPELKKMLRECSATKRAKIASLENNVRGLANEEKCSRIKEFTETGDIEVLSVKTAYKLNELHEEFEGNLKKIVRYITEAT